jgi:hypothetical protein
MKKLLSLLLLLSLVLSLALPAAAAGTEGFEIDENGVLTRYTGPGGEVTIPEGVTEIGETAFLRCGSLTGVTIPGSVKVIGRSAFANCENLTRVNLGEGVTEISRMAFSACLALADVAIPGSVRTIGANAFDNCWSLSGVTFSEGVTEIGDQAFYGCKSLTGVTLPSTVTTIGMGAFYDCKALQSVTLPDTVASIGANAFAGTPWLASQGDFAIAGGVLLAYQGKAAEVTVPAGVAAVAGFAFAGRTDVTAVTLPAGLKSIGDSAFSGCTGLGSISFPAGLRHIGKSAFYGCGSLGSVTISTDALRIGALAFFGCGSLTTVTVSSGVTAFGDSAFSGCGSLTGFTVRGRVESVGARAFEGTPWLASQGDFHIVGDLLLAYRGSGGEVTIPEGVRRIEAEAFAGCTGLTGVTIPTSVTEIGDRAFSGCAGLRSIRAFCSPLEMGQSVIEGCSALENAVFPAMEREAEPMKSENLLRSRYLYAGEFGSRYGDVVDSCLYWDGEGYVRAENVNGIVIVERYSPEFRLLSSRSLERDLVSFWGGFFIGEYHHFMVIGHSNGMEDDSVPVVVVTKYSKQWEKLGQGSLLGANTVVPFDYGSLRCAEAGDMLYIRTCHMMYGGGGFRHQANLTFSLRQSDMAVTDAQYKIAFRNGYVSHSFDQFILADREDELLALDLGDASPRALLLQKYGKAAGNESFAGGTTDIALLDIPGEKGDSATGVSAGGLGETERGIVAVWNYNGAGADKRPVRNVYFSWTDKGDFSLGGTRILQVTDFPEDGDQSAGIPVLAPTGPDGGYILWDVLHVNQKRGYVDEEGPQIVAWARYDADGNVGEIRTAPGALSDCPPICVNGKLVWYVTEDSVPVFYTLDESGLKTQTALWQAPEAIKVKTDGELVWWTDAEPFIDASSRTMVPLRAVAEALGLTVTWDGQAREAVFTDGTRTIAFPIGSTEARRGDGGTVAMDTAAVIVGGRTYAPIRYLAEYFGYQVGWDGRTKTVLLTKGA